MDDIRIYVGTYAKYNAGSIAGEWLCCDHFPNKENFLEAAKALHANESDPELMFQDYEGFPKAFYGESSIDERLWDWLRLSDDERESVSLYLDNVDDKAAIDDARDAFSGKADNKADFAEQWLEDTCGLEGIPKHLENYIDFAAYARDMELGGDIVFVRHEGEVWAFRNAEIFTQAMTFLSVSAFFAMLAGAVVVYIVTFVTTKKGYSHPILDMAHLALAGGVILVVIHLWLIPTLVRGITGP